MKGPRAIVAQPLTRDAFAPFGDVLDKHGEEPRPMNNGRARRFHALARGVASGADAAIVLSIAEATPYLFPLKLELVERHPLGSQAFMPLSPAPFLVTVCPDEDGRPGAPLAFLSAPSQGVSYRAGTWHGVLTPIGAVQDFLIVDRAGEGANLEEFRFREPYEIHLPGMTV